MQTVHKCNEGGQLGKRDMRQNKLFSVLFYIKTDKKIFNYEAEESTPY